MRSRGAMKHALVAAIAALAVSLSAATVPAQETLHLDPPLATQGNPMTVVVDARKATIGLAYTHMTIPGAPGPFTIDYPEWIPGDHSPSGPLSGISELRITANGAPLHWDRDQVDLHA